MSSDGVVQKAVQKATATAAGMGKNYVLIEVGKAFGDWLARENMTPERMTASLLAGEPLLRQAIAQIPEAEIRKYRGGAAAKVVAQITTDDYVLVLRQAAMHAKAAPCATLLRKDSVLYWKHFVPAMNAVKAWFIDGTPL